MSDIVPREANSKPTVYFIDDSATMREVVKIAFRREDFNVVTCSDMASAVAQFEENAPQAVISDVIMPDKDGYQLCEYIKQHPKFGGIPVFLMSGVVNKEVAERAHQVKADELIRKPFHPQELVARVKKLLNHAEPSPVAAPKDPEGANPLSALFGPTASPIFPTPPPPPAFAPPRMPQATKTVTAAPPGNGLELQKLQVEVKRLEALVKKLQNELSSEREYCATLESQLEALSTAK
jgi:DNA-binding response OmpR family regulator